MGFREKWTKGNNRKGRTGQNDLLLLEVKRLVRSVTLFKILMVSLKPDLRDEIDVSL
jgi:hypothetical protein